MCDKANNRHDEGVKLKERNLKVIQAVLTVTSNMLMSVTSNMSNDDSTHGYQILSDDKIIEAV